MGFLRRVTLAFALLAFLGVGLSPRGASAGDDPPAPAAPRAAAGLPDAEMLRHFAKVTGKLLAKYLEDKADPAKAAAWDDFLKGLSEDLQALPESGDEAGLAGLVRKVMTRVSAGMNDPAKRVVMGEILGVMVAEVLPELMRRAAPKTAKPEPRAEPWLLHEPLFPRLRQGALRGLRRGAPEVAEEDPLVAGGAHLHLVCPAGKPSEVRFVVEHVDADSAASRLGLSVGDTITALGGSPVTLETPAAMRRGLSRRGELSLTVLRQGNEVVLDRRTRK